MDLSLMLFIALCFLFLIPSTTALDCNACKPNYCDNPLDLSCPNKRAACFLASTIFGEYVETVEDICDNDSDRMKNREEIDDAKQMLFDADLAKPSDFDGVKIRFCRHISQEFSFSAFGVSETVTIDAAGMVPNKNKILLHTDVLDYSTIDLAILLAHELHHIKQYRDWGTDGFRCRYMDAILECGCTDGDDGNDVEKDADKAEDVAQKKLTKCIWAASLRQCDNSEATLVTSSSMSKFHDAMKEKGDKGMHLVAGDYDNFTGQYLGYFLKSQGTSWYQFWVRAKLEDLVGDLSSALEDGFEATAIFRGDGQYIAWLRKTPTDPATQYWYTKDTEDFQEKMTSAMNEGYIMDAGMIDDEGLMLGWFKKESDNTEWKWTQVYSIEQLHDDLKEKLEDRFHPTALMNGCFGGDCDHGTSIIAYQRIPTDTRHWWATRWTLEEIKDWITDNWEKDGGYCLTSLTHSCF